MCDAVTPSATDPAAAMQSGALMRLRKILCPVDFSQGATTALSIAVRLANENNAELVVAHVFQLPTPLALGEPMLPSEVRDSVADDTKERLEMVLASARDLGAKRVTSMYVTGTPWVEIVDLLDHDATFDLVVMGTHGRTGVSRVLLGSVTEKVVRHAPCSVLTMRADATVGSYTKILCPVDFSDASQTAMDMAAAMRGQTITLLHTIEISMPYGADPYPAVYLRDMKERAEEELEREAADLYRLAEVPIRWELREGRAQYEITKLVEDDRTFDLVVIGSHGRTGLKRALIGSVAEAVVRHARCPVLVARSRRQEPVV
jgi:nucleotide-binding universal stress UspA family protein